MSYQARQRKRKAKAKKRSIAKNASRNWYLTVVGRDSSCGRCGGRLKRDREMVYRHEPRSMLCVTCAEADGNIHYRPSQRWEKTHGKRKRKVERAARGARVDAKRKREAAEQDVRAEASMRAFREREEERRRRREEWERENSPDPARAVPRPAELRLLASLGHEGDRPATQHDAQVLIRRLIDASAEAA